MTVSFDFIDRIESMFNTIKKKQEKKKKKKKNLK
jgi:hypothetical protein